MTLATIAPSPDRLRQVQARLERVVAAVRDVLFETDAEGRWTFLGPAWETSTGHAVDASLGRPLLDFVHPEDRAQCEATLAAVAAGATRSGRLTARFVTRHGGVRWMQLHARPLLDGDGDAPLGTAGTLADVTDQSLAVESVRASEARLRLLIEQAPTAVAMFDAERRLLVASARWHTTMGPAAVTLSGAAARGPIPGLAADWDALWARVLGGETVRREEDPVEDRDGYRAWLTWEAQPWRGVDGRPGGVVLWCDDASERRRALDRLALLQRVTALCAAADDAPGALAGTLAPLCAAAGWPYAEAWVRDGDALVLSHAWHDGRPGADALAAEGRALRTARGQGLVGVAWASGAPTQLFDAPSAPSIRRGAAFSRAGLRSLLAFPVGAGDALAGVLLFATDRPSHEDARQMTLVASVVAQLEALVLRKRAEAALAVRQAEYALLVEHAVDVLYRIAPDGRFLFANARAAERLRVPEGTIVGRHFLEFVRPDHRARALAHYAAQLEARTPSTYLEFPAVAADGTELWVGQHVQLEQVDGRVVALSAVARVLGGPPERPAP